MKKFLMVLFQLLGFVLGAAALFSLTIVGMDLINRRIEDGKASADAEE